MKKKIVFFGTLWAGPCAKLKNILQTEVKAYNPDIEIEFVDVDKNPRRTRNEGIHSIPTIKLYADDKLISRITGIKRGKDILDIFKIAERGEN